MVSNGILLRWTELELDGAGCNRDMIPFLLCIGAMEEGGCDEGDQDRLENVLVGLPMGLWPMYAIFSSTRYFPVLLHL